jgi:hypothetical protein
MGDEEQRRWDTKDWRWIDPVVRFAFDKAFWQIVSANWTPAEIARLMRHAKEPPRPSPTRPVGGQGAACVEVGSRERR